MTTQKRIPFSLKIDPETLDELRNAAHYMSGYPHGASISSLTESAVQNHLIYLKKSKLKEELREHLGEFPKRSSW